MVVDEMAMKTTALTQKMLEMEEVVDDNAKKADVMDRMVEWMEEMAPVMKLFFYWRNTVDPDSQLDRFQQWQLHRVSGLFLRRLIVSLAEAE